MQASATRDKDNRRYRVEVAISDIEMTAGLRPEYVLADIRAVIANRLADVVMDALEPAIGKALKSLHFDAQGKGEQEPGALTDG